MVWAYEVAARYYLQAEGRKRTDLGVCGAKNGGPHLDQDDRQVEIDQTQKGAGFMMISESCLN